MINAKEARENIEIIGRDDIDERSLSEPRPTRREFLRAVSTLNRYLAHINDPLARSLEELLATLTRQTRQETRRKLS